MMMMMMMMMMATPLQQTAGTVFTLELQYFLHLLVSNCS